MEKGHIICKQFESEILKNNPLGDQSLREVVVYLPPGYEADRRFPSVYFLTGFTGRGKMLLNDKAFSPNLAERMDLLIESGKIRPMIVVMPDCFTRYGGSQYINSALNGNYEDYLTEEIVPFVDENFRTLPDRNSRAVTGSSSGGYGALSLAMRRPDIFGLCTALSADAYFETCYLPDFPKAFRAIKGDPEAFFEKFRRDEKRGGNDFPALNIIGMSACYSPNPESETGYDLPFDLETGEIRADVWGKWIAKDPVRMVEKYADNLKSLRLLFIDAGTRDEFAMDIGARVFSKRLRDFGVPHLHEEFDDGHFNIAYRYNRSLEMISEKIDRG